MLSAVAASLKVLFPASWLPANLAHASPEEICGTFIFALALWALAQVPVTILWLKIERAWLRAFRLDAQAGVRRYRALMRLLFHEINATKEMAVEAMVENARLKEKNESRSGTIRQLEEENKQLRDALGGPGFASSATTDTARQR